MMIILFLVLVDPYLYRIFATPFTYSGVSLDFGLSGYQYSKLSSMTRPTFLFVPGAWHTPDIYSAVMGLLNNESYPTVGLPLPSIGATPPHASFDEDVKAIRDTLTKLIDTEAKEVALVVHSYAGMPRSAKGPRQGRAS